MTKYSLGFCVVMMLVGLAATGCSVDAVTQAQFNDAAVKNHCSTVVSNPNESTINCAGDCRIIFKTLGDVRDAQFEFEGIKNRFLKENDVQEKCNSKSSCEYSHTSGRASTTTPSRRFLKLKADSGRLLYIHQVDNTIFEFIGAQ